MTRLYPTKRLLVLLLSVCLAGLSFGAIPKKAKPGTKKPAVAAGKKSVLKKASLKQSGAKKKKGIVATRTRRGTKFVSTSYRKGKGKKGRRYARLRVTGGPWTEPTYADSTLGDNVEGEDLTVRRAAVEALGPYNGTVLVADPQTGRLLTVVNQKIAFRQGFQPCSTIKIVAALAGLNEGIIDRTTNMRLYGRTTMNLTDALARSNNPYFANIGVRLGYDKIAQYSKMLGLGEKAGHDIPEEIAGTIPPAPPANGGMGMMTSFGEGIKLTPIQLTAMLSAVANGGTLHYLQYPRSQEAAKNLVPKVKRELAIESSLPEMIPGLLGAVEYGTARRAGYSYADPLAGKTGTCTDRATPTHLGWFGSFNQVNGRKLVVVVLLTGGRSVNGPVASGIAGAVYQNLAQNQFFAGTRGFVPPVALVSGSSW